MRSHAPPHAKNDTLRSVRRALDVLDLLAAHPEGLPIKRIACDLRLNISTCYHLLNTLMASGYVQRDPETSMIRLGLKVASLSNSLALRVSDQPEWKPLRPLLYDLTEATHAASYLALWQDGDTVIQSIVEWPDAEKVPELYVGFRGGSHMHALGRALLSVGGHDALQQYMQHPGIAAKIQQHALNLDALRRILDETRTRGFSLDLEEFKPGICYVGAPVTAKPEFNASTRAGVNRGFAASRSLCAACANPHPRGSPHKPRSGCTSGKCRFCASGIPYRFIFVGRISGLRTCSTTQS